MTEQEKAAREKELSDWLETYTGPITTGPIRTAREAEVDEWLRQIIRNNTEDLKAKYPPLIHDHMMKVVMERIDQIDTDGIEHPVPNYLANKSNL